jgi:hypothetical protein
MRDEASPVSGFADVVVILGLLLLGGGVMLSPLVFREDTFEQVRSLRLAAAILCLLNAGTWYLLRRAIRDLRRMDDLLTDVRFGPGTKRDRDAVDILVQALRAPDARARETALRTLRKISGMDLGEDPAAWERWWTVARATFTRPGPAPKK